MADKEQIDKAYEAIEVAKTTGKIRKGVNEVTKTIEKGTAKLVVYAKDVNPKEIVMHLAPLCKEKDIPCVEVDAKVDLGAAAGLALGTSAVAILKEGESKGLIKEINDNEESDSAGNEDKKEEKPAKEEQKPAEEEEKEEEKPSEEKKEEAPQKDEDAKKAEE